MCAVGAPVAASDRESRAPLCSADQGWDMRPIEAVSGAVYRVEDKPLPRDGGRARIYRCRDELGVVRLYKEYRTPIGDQSVVRQAADICAQGRDLVSEAQPRADLGGTAADSVGWPLDAVQGAGAGLAGMVVPLAPLAFYQPDGSARTFDRLVRTTPDPVAVPVRLKVLIRLCEILRFLESRGLVHGALSAEHLLWHEDGGVYLIGTDGLRPAGVGVVGDRGAPSAWRDPRLAAGLIEAPDEYSDRYSVALALYSGLFLQEEPPQDRLAGAWSAATDLPAQLAPRLHDLFSRAFAGPLAAEGRPEAAQWSEAMAEVYLAGEGYRSDQIQLLASQALLTSQPSEQPRPTSSTVRPSRGPAPKPAPAPAPRPEAPPTSTTRAPRQDAPPVTKRPPTSPAPRPASPRSSLAARRRARRGWLIGSTVLAAIVLVFVVLAMRPTASAYAPGAGASGPNSPVNAVTDTSAPDATASDLNGTGGDTAAATTGDSTASPSPTSTGDGSAQAQAISQVLSQSAKDRNLVANAVQVELGGCQNLSQGVQDLDQAATDRGNEYNDAEQLQVGALVNGDQLKQALLTALSASQQADEAYARWGASLDPSTCQVPAPENSDFAAGDVASQQATAAKNEFISLWAPVAATYGLTVPNESVI